MTSVAFDRLAATYDQHWTNSAIGRAQRDQVWSQVDPLFNPGDSLVDIGCGTGADAAHLAALGMRVHATDPSPAMIAEARRHDTFTTQILRAQDLATLSNTYDGAISNFGALNCVPELPGAALAQLLKPGAKLAICTIGRFCAWELLFHPIRRLRGTASSSLGIIYYPTVAQIRRALPDFTLDSWSGIGVFVPPSYVRLPAALVRICAALDRVFARLPFFRALADHRLLIFTRRPHAS